MTFIPRVDRNSSVDVLNVQYLELVTNKNTLSGCLHPFEYWPSISGVQVPAGLEEIALVR